MVEQPINGADLTGKVPESAQSPGEKRELFGNIAVINRNIGARIAWSTDHQVLKVNTTLFPSEDLARIAILRQVGTNIGLTQAIRTDSSLLLDLTTQYPKASDLILRWQGMARMKEMNQNIFHKPLTLQNQTLTQEFQSALDIYVLTGKYPGQLSDTVRQVLERIPKPNGRSLIDYISSGRYLKFDGENFSKYMQPLIDELADADKKISKSEKFEYRPTPPQDLDENKEKIQESDIMVSVTPFYGGYYREQVVYYDPTKKQIVKDAGEKELWLVSDIPDTVTTLKTKRTYKGILISGKETIVKLPYNALPLNATLNPPNALQFMRDDLGIISLDKKNGQASDIKEFSFDFVLTETDSNRLDLLPTQRDYSPIGGTLDSDSQTLIDDLSTNTWMSDVQKAREVALYVRKKLRYPKDKAEIAQIDSVYLSVEPEELWAKIAEVGVAHCYWANILRDELCKRLGIASRIVTGPYVSTKDPKFDFAIVEAKGLDKHAWGEVWDSDEVIWTHKGMDATPAKEKDNSQDQNEQTQPLDGDFGDVQLDQAEPELSKEEIEELYNQLLEKNETTESPPTPDELAAQQFEKEKGVKLRDWTQLEAWVNKVNNTEIPAEQSIKPSNGPSTLYKEWRNLFDLLYKRREIPREVYKGPVRQSEGEFLDDPVTAYIDVRSHDDDPLGYQRERIKHKEKVEVSAFDDDFILDISGSMSGLPGEEQRKMVMSSEYNIKNLNDRLNNSQNRAHMTTPLNIRSRVAVFGDWTKVAQESTDTITEKGLIALNEAIKTKKQSSKGLAESLKQYKESLDKTTAQKIKNGAYKKVLTVVTDGEIDDQAKCIALIKELRDAGIIVQGIGFGREAKNIKVVLHDPSDPDAAVVINNITQATLARHKLLMKHLSKL